MSLEEKIDMIHDTVLDLKRTVDQHSRLLLQTSTDVDHVQRTVTALKVQVSSIKNTVGYHFPVRD